MTTVLQTGEEKRRFLEVYRRIGVISKATEQVGVARSQVYRWQENDDEFAGAFREAQLACIEAAEAELYRRGMHGWSRPVFQGGVQVGTLLERDTIALLAWLKANNREKYGDRLDVSHAGMVAKAYVGVNLGAILKPPDDEPAGASPNGE